MALVDTSFDYRRVIVLKDGRPELSKHGGAEFTAAIARARRALPPIDLTYIRH